MVGKVSGTSPNFADHADRLVWRNALSDLPQSLSKSAWSDSVLAAEAIKAGIVNEAARLTPRRPSLTGRLAWIHWLSVKLELVMHWIERLNSVLNFTQEGRQPEGEHLKRWRTFGALKADRKRIKPS